MAAIALLLLAIVLGVTLHKVREVFHIIRCVEGEGQERTDLTSTGQYPSFPFMIPHQALNKPPFTRERPPLVALPMRKRNPMAIYPTGNSVLFDTGPDTTAFSNSVTLKGFTMKIEQEVLEAKCEPIDEVPPQDELEILSVNSLRRSVSQMMDGKSVTGDDEVWDPNISGHDSGMFMDDEEFVDTVKGFSTVRKEHTMFTDTNL
ncbi:usherin isoform X2 [Anarrhichthys ocellatus]|uniref:usherin isoform X2 n=1 Tax=Anarrhichthys ocellatus TaxID=433405 RepID=UPI0012EE09C9|nr:usherin-like isoform X2 [Anarrhichthys ocellatus]